MVEREKKTSELANEANFWLKRVNSGEHSVFTLYEEGLELLANFVGNYSADQLEVSNLRS